MSGKEKTFDMEQKVFVSRSALSTAHDYFQSSDGFTNEDEDTPKSENLKMSSNFIHQPRATLNAGYESTLPLSSY